MTWSYKQNITLQIIEVTFSGSTSSLDLQDSTSKLIALEKEIDLNKFLIDTREMKFNGSLVDIFNLPAEQYEKEGADRNGRIAVIQPDEPKEREVVRFYETACVNRGWNVRIFSDRQPAINWLTLSNDSHDSTTADSSV